MRSTPTSGPGVHRRPPCPSTPPETRSRKRTDMSDTTAEPPRVDATADAPAGAGPDRRPVLSHKEILTILVGLMMGMFLAALDQTIVASAMRVIADDLNDLAGQAWVTTAYLITSTIATPLYGKLGDIYGRKKLFLFAITIFTIGSMLCTLAWSIPSLAAFRAVQGIGAGGLFSLALAIIGDIVPPRERAKYQGYFLAVFGTSSVLGPVIGGFFAGADTILGITGWRWVFLVNVPIGIAALFVVAEQGRGWGWGSASSITCYVIGGIGVIAFFLIERAMGHEALLPVHLFRIRTVGVSSIASVILGMGMF